jgi:membrane-associated phospholipid phosphatase
VRRASRLTGTGRRELAWFGLLVTLSVVATGNHYLFDVAASLLVAALAFALSRLALRPPRAPRTTNGAALDQAWALEPAA